ncbi:unnamed protein product [Fraxinus pennsylvanica]|uniref:Uncharacterized protein n=1 Tax=Fraxinus pennsylvanica TaxID=56036 RepID=A0AAD1Z3B9_9LAMI|nr:unnamed protein product [Fraxinus pennsylvanica]
MSPDSYTNLSYWFGPEISNFTGDENFCPKVPDLGLAKMMGREHSQVVTMKLANGAPTKVADRRLEGAFDEEELMRALKVAFWYIKDEISMRPMMGKVVKMLEGLVNINMTSTPQTVLELIEEGLDHVYKAMK